MDVGTALDAIPPAICADFMCCHCKGRWAVFNSTHGKDSGAFREGLLYSYYYGPDFIFNHYFLSYHCLICSYGVPVLTAIKVDTNKQTNKLLLNRWFLEILTQSVHDIHNQHEY